MITEDKVIALIQVLLEPNTIEVEWKNRVLRDGEVIASTASRKAYNQDQKAEFLAEVEGAEAYIQALGWTS